ncbi:unnamed protein product, partial [Trichogramma brassicae]
MDRRREPQPRHRDIDAQCREKQRPRRATSRKRYVGKSNAGRATSRSKTKQRREG